MKWTYLQGTAKELYVVTDGDLKKLGSLSKSNPHKKDWSQMRLFLESQVVLCLSTGAIDVTKVKYKGCSCFL